jgi:hypothetical protein
MTTTNAKTAGVPGFWKKCWNALVDLFKPYTGCSCASETKSPPKVEAPGPQEKQNKTLAA